MKLNGEAMAENDGSMSILGSGILEEFFENSAQPLWMFDLEDGRFLAVNRAACERYGYTREEMLRMTLFDIRPAADAPLLRAALDRILERGISGPPNIWRHRTKFGKQMLVEVLSNLVHYESRNVVLSLLRDVTEQQSFIRERHRFFELSQDILAIRSPEDGLLSINPAGERILGWSAEEFLTQPVSQIIHPDDLPARQQAFERMRSVGGSQTWLARARTKDGNYRWLQWSGTIDEESDRIYVVARDVSEAREMHERLAQSEANLAWAQSVSHLGSWRYDVEAGRFSLSDEYYRITGYEPGGYAPTWDNIIGCVHPEDRYLIDVGMEGLPNPWKPQQIELRILRPNGEVRNIVSFVDAVFAPDGSLKRMLGTIRDVTELKKAHEVQAWLAEIVSSSSEAILGKSLDGTIQSWNKAAEEMYGYSAEEILGKNVETLIPPYRRGELKRILARLRKGERIEEFETERIDRYGHVFEASITISPIRSDNGRIIGAAAVCRDISARKEAERQLKSRLAQLTALRSIDASIAGTFELPLTLEVVVTQTLATTDVELVCLCLRDKATAEPQILASGARFGGAVSDDDREEVCKLAGLAIRERRLVRSRPASGRSAVWEARPLFAKGEINGVLVVRHADGGERAIDQLNFLDALAGQAAIGIESALLFEDLERSRNDLFAAYDQTLEGWARALDLRDHETEGHSRRVTELTTRLAMRLGLSPEEVTHIRWGALLHDIGKLGVPDRILLKPGPLDEDEWSLMRRHPMYGRDIIAPIAFLRPALDIPYCHHEKWDGTGYPRGLKGEEIPVGARLFAMADVWDALTSDRPYRPAWSSEQALAHMKSQAGSHFDPTLISIFVEEVTLT